MDVVITGASRGIGLELARLALENGDRVLAVARKPEESPELRALKSKHRDKLEVAAIELTDPSAGELLGEALAEWERVDVLINNAGVYHQGETTEDFLDSFHVNAVAPFLVTKALLPKLRKSPGPKAVQITSLMGSISDNESGGSYAYRSSKAALNMIMKTFSRSDPWLTSIVIHPGWVQTRMGGPEAPTPVATSAAGIWKVVRGLAKTDSGKFFDFEGHELPW